MKRILVVHHSASGGTNALVAAFRDGALLCTGVETITRSAGVATVDDLLAASALVLATPENFGTMAGTLKAFLDRTFYGCMTDTTAQGGGTDSLLAGRPYTTLICAGSDGSGAVQSVDRIVTGWRMKKIHPGIIARRIGGEAGSPRGELRAEDLNTSRELGQLFAEGLAAGVL